MTRDPVPVGTVVYEVVEQIQRTVYGDPINLLTCSDEVRRGYDQGSRDGFDRGIGAGQREAYDAGYAVGFREGQAFTERSTAATEQTAALIEAGVRRFREDHEQRRRHVGGGAR